MRWQAYAHVARQSLSFFQNDFAGRIVTKVWSAGQATGDLMISLLQVVWFIGIYAVTTLVLVGQLDWRLAAVVVALDRRLRRARALFRAAHPRPFQGDGGGGLDADRPHGRHLLQHPDAEAVRHASDENDRYIREGFDLFQATLIAASRAC